MKLLLLGMSHRSAPVEVRERFAVADNEPMLRKLVDRPGIEEAVLLSTCNRVEVVVTTQNADAARHVLLDFFARDLAVDDLPAGLSLSDLTYLRQGRDAVNQRRRARRRDRRSRGTLGRMIRRSCRWRRCPIESVRDVVPRQRAYGA